MACSWFTGRLAVLWMLCGEMVYVYYVVLRFRKGLPRLLALLPILPPSLIMPWRAQTGPERILYCFLFLWMIMSKLLLLVWDMGPAADPHAISSFPRFFSAMTFSLHLNRDKQFSSSGPVEDARDDNVGSRRSNEGQSDRRNGLARRKATAAAELENVEVKDGEAKGHIVEEKEPLRRRGADEEEARSFLWPRWLEIVVNSDAGQIVVLRSLIYFIVGAFLIRIVQEYRHVLSIYALYLLLPFVMYFSCLFLFESTAGASACLLGTQLHPQFNMPFLADSLADFWGRRWNLLVNNLLRVSVYEPMLSFLIIHQQEKEEQKKRRATPLNRAIATGAAFLVSGLMHELIFFYLNKTRPTGEMTAFFVLNGAATIAEGLVKPRDRLGMPTLLRRAYTLVFVYVTASWLFFPPVFRTGMVDQCLTDLQTFSNWIRHMIVTPPLLDRK